MKKALPIIFACAPVWGAVVFAPLACKISGPTTGINQGAMVVRLLFLVAYLFLSIVPIKVATEISEPKYSKKMMILGAILWLPGSLLNYYLIYNTP
jgi:hypothetical protein